MVTGAVRIKCKVCWYKWVSKTGDLRIAKKRIEGCPKCGSMQWHGEIYLKLIYRRG